MSHVSTGVRGIFERSFFYNAFQKGVGRDRAFRYFVEQRLRPQAGEQILDIGCGTGTILDFLPEGIGYTGFDMNADYIDHAREVYGDRGAFVVGKVEAAYPDFNRRFDAAFAYGLLHHLDDDASEKLFADAAAWLKPGGRFVTMDPVWHPESSSAARWLIGKDRGQNVRSPEGYQTLAQRHFPKVEGQTVRGVLRIPYIHYALHCSL
jgi:SAM-dependent methyltransferase